MNKVLRNPLEVKKKDIGTAPWDAGGYTKDQAHSGCIAIGTDFGVGRRTPVGSERAKSMADGPIPQKSHCFSPNEIFQNEDRRG
jgi:hypothetical protein